MKKKSIIIIFFVGLLLMGIGSGISFAEFSSFHYGGEKSFSGEMTKVTLNQTLPEDVTTVYLLLRGYDWGKVRIEPDSTLAPGQIAIDITCDDKLISPYIEEYKEYLESSEEETGDLESSEKKTGDLESSEEETGDLESPEESKEDFEPLEENKPVAQIAYSLGYFYHGSYDEASAFFQIKDEFLKDIKNRMVYTYTNDDIENVTIKAAPELAEHLYIR